MIVFEIGHAVMWWSFGSSVCREGISSINEMDHVLLGVPSTHKVLVSRIIVIDVIEHYHSSCSEPSYY